ncbi:hypothetical protein [Sodalis sp.]
MPEGYRNPFGEATNVGDYHLREPALYCAANGGKWRKIAPI